MWIYKDGKPKLWKIKYWEKVLKNYVKEQTFLKQIILSKDDMDRFEKKKEKKKIRPVENTW